MTELAVSIAICTFNRSHLLRGALDSVLDQSVCPLSFEILVIDNGSSDDTRCVVDDYRDRHPGIRYCLEPQPGIAHARNRAAKEAWGVYLAFLDDDARAERNWLASLLEAVSTVTPQPACVVGPVLLEWEGGRPSWFPSKLEPLLCSYDLGSEGHFMGPDGYLLTTNVLMRRAVLLDLGGFCTYLGRERGKLIGGEDNDMYQRIVGAGYGIYYTPLARVHHGVPRERQSRGYLLRRVYWDGASQPLLDFGTKQSRRFYAFQVFRELRRISRLAVEFIAAIARNRQEERADCSLALVQRMGRLRTNLNLVVKRNND